MTDQGGRDTEKDLFDNRGGYKTILSKNTLESSCPKCGGKIEKESYMGGAVYFCPKCQKL
jgi:formamidopyrimidine-DNA glycosylase